MNKEIVLSRDDSLDGHVTINDFSATTRQLEVLRLCSQGLGYKGVAKELELTPTTVQGHVDRLRARNNGVSTTELAAIAEGNELLLELTIKGIQPIIDQMPANSSLSIPWTPGDNTPFITSEDDYTLGEKLRVLVRVFSSYVT